MLNYYEISNENVDRKYQGYLNKKEEYSKLDFGYKVLRDLCSNNLKHTEPGKIYAKIWIIGRSYAAPIDRRKNKTKDNNNKFYIERVVPTIQNSGDYLDLQIEKLCKYENLNEENIKEALDLHKYLTDVFNTLTGLNMRSLASKYLHFHCPKMFFIYDSIANREIKELVKKVKSIKYTNFDPEYVDFCYRSLALMNYIKATKPYEKAITPRDIDNILYKE